MPARLLALFAVALMLAAGLPMAAAQQPAAAAPAKIGRPIVVVSVAICRKPIEEMARIVESEAAGADLVVLCECWPGGKAYGLDDQPITALAAVAKKHRTYIVSPMYRTEGKTIFNSSVLIDRQGKVAGIYNKYCPVLNDPPGTGGEVVAGTRVRPGQDAPVFQTDFGRLGMTICFDAQFPEVWQRLAEQDAQLVVFSSMYSAGQALGAYAMLHHYYIVSSINRGECQAFDITGEKLLDQPKPISRVTLDMDRRIFHNNDSYNYRKQREKLLKENPGVVVDKWLRREDWHVLKAVQPGIDLPALARKYDLQDLRTYLNKQRAQRDGLRQP
jgi:predicted amidohydrolase